jgi:hypothetical protein
VNDMTICHGGVFLRLVVDLARSLPTGYTASFSTSYTRNDHTSNDVIQIFNLEYFNKTDQTGLHQQKIDIFQSGLVGTALIQDHFMWKVTAINRWPERQ